MPDRRFARLFSLLLLSGLSAHAARADVTTPTSAAQQDNRLSVFHDYSINAVGQTTSTSTGTPGDALINNVLQDSWTITPGSSRGYTLSLSPFVGYDSNPEARRVSHNAIFGGGDLNAGYQLNYGADDAVVGRPTQIVFNYDAVGAIFEGEDSQADAFQQKLSGSIQQSLFGSSIQLRLKVDDQFTMLHDEATLNTIDVAPSVEGFILPQVSAEIGYDYSNFDYFGLFGPRRDSSTDRNTFNAKLHLYTLPQVRGVPVPESPDVLTDILRATLSRATLGYAHVWNSSNGSFYRYEGDRVYVGFEGLKLPRTDAITMDIMYAFESDRYANPDYEGQAPIFGHVRPRKQRDELNILTLRANARLLDLPKNRGSLSAYLQWDYLANQTFTRDRAWNEFSIGGGIAYRY